MNIAGIIIYTILLVLFFVLEKEFNYNFELECIEHKCFRFCCKNETLCTESFVEENFNSSYGDSHDSSFWFYSDEESDTGENNTNRMKAYFGEPHCYLKETDPDKPWKIEPVSNGTGQKRRL